MNTHTGTWLAHIRALAVDIGPRGSTTEGERRGAAYCAEVFRRLGLAPQVEGKCLRDTRQRMSTDKRIGARFIRLSVSIRCCGPLKEISGPFSKENVR
jgi:hypothetical protein